MYYPVSSNGRRWCHRRFPDPQFSLLYNKDQWEESGRRRYQTIDIFVPSSQLVLQMHTNQVTPIEQLETLGNFRHSGGVQCANNFSVGSTTYSWGGYDDGWLRRRGAHPTPAAAAAAAVVVSGKNSSVCTAVSARSGAMTDVELKDTNAVSYGTVESSLVRRRKGEPKSVWDDDSSDSEDEANDRDSRRLR